MSEPNHRLHATVSGDVQGVSFRYYTQHRAGQLGLTGWVKNLLTGEVEVLAEGSHAALEQLLEFLQQGPQLAEVKSIKAEWATASGEFRRFDVRM